MDEPVFSPDGQFMWTGSEWVPAPPVSEQSELSLSIQDSAVSGDVTHITNISSADPDIIKVALDSAIELSNISQESDRRNGSIIQIPMEILEQCMVEEVSNKGEYTVEWHLPGNSPPELKAAMQAIGGSHRKGNSPLDYYDITKFDAETQAKIWSMWNKAKNFWRLFDEKSATTSQIVVQPPNQSQILIPAHSQKSSSGGLTFGILCLICAALSYSYYSNSICGTFLSIFASDDCSIWNTFNAALAIIGIIVVISALSNKGGQATVVGASGLSGSEVASPSRSSTRRIGRFVGFALALLSGATVLAGVLYVWASGSGWTTIESRSMTLNEDDYYLLDEITGYSEYKWELSSSTSIVFDVYFLDAEGCQQWANSGLGSHLTQLSWGNMDSNGGKGPVTVGSGDTFCWVVDNSDRGAAMPPWNGINDPISVTFTVSAR